MSKKTVFLFPGQGAQYPGMGHDFYQEFPAARLVFQEADDLLSQKFSSLIFHGSANELALTKNSQLAIYVVSLAIWRTFQKEYPEIIPAVCAGLSLGEYSALTASGKLSFQEGLQLVKSRASFMQEACESHPGSMQVALGFEEEEVREAIEGLNGVWIANLNCPGQVVIAGTKEGLEKATEELKKRKKCRVLPLEVSGAFHSGLMEQARQKLEPFIRSTQLSSGQSRIVMNAIGDFVDNSTEIYQCMIDQVTHPVLWQKGIEAMRAENMELYLEMGPGKTLIGMNRRIGIEENASISLETVKDFEKRILDAVT